MGDEAHIVARSRGGPRAGGGLAEADLDAYDNMILLSHHKVVDDQPLEYTRERLTLREAVHGQVAPEDHGQRVEQEEGQVAERPSQGWRETTASSTRGCCALRGVRTRRGPARSRRRHRRRAAPVHVSAAHLLAPRQSRRWHQPCDQHARHHFRLNVGRSPHLHPT